jgi:G3E family GTPase
VSPERTRILLVSGFLGSGKTSFARHFLTQLMPAGAKAHLVVNEIGQVNLDAAILGRYGQETLKLLAGCICCSGKQELFEGLQRLLDPVRGPLPEWLLIESSGLADPADILDTLLHPKIRARAGLAAAVTVVDAARFPALARQSPLLERQVAWASLVLANKADLLPEPARQGLGQRLSALNLRASLVWTQEGALPAEIWGRELEQPSLLQGHAFHDAHHISFGGWYSVEWRPSQAIGRAALEEALHALPPEVERVKGYLELADGEPVLVQRTGEQLRLHAWEKESSLVPQLTLIGRGLEVDKIKALLDRLLVTKA